MLNRIIKFSLNNRLLVLVASVLLMLGGLFVTSQMDVDVFPDLNAPTVVVMTEAGGMAPEEVECLVTYPVETAVNGAAGVRRVRSSSTTGFSVVWVEFNWGTDIYRARQIVAEKMSAVQDALPSTVGNPTLAPQSSILGEMMLVTLTSDSVSLQQLRTLADWTIRPRILATGGVAQVTVLGGEIKEYQLLLSPARMKHYSTGLNEVIDALQRMNQNVAGGILNQYGNEYIIRGVLSTADKEKLGAAFIKNVDGNAVCLSDVAEVRIGNRTPRMGAGSYNTKPSVMMTITKQPGVSTLDLTASLDKALEELQSNLPSGVQMKSDAYRQSRFIESSIGNVRKALMEGGVFVVVVLFLFLMNTRTTLISLITIPLSLLFTILTLRLLELNINTMSLGGMCIAIGALVDDAIVDVENVFKKLRENRLLPPAEQRSVLGVVFDASREVRMPILNSTLIIIASFVPLFFLSGMEGRMLAPLGVAFIVSLLASTLVALTLTPVLCSYLLGKNHIGRNLKEPAWVSGMKALYVRALCRSVKHRKAVLLATGGALLVSLLVFFTLGRSFLPPFNEGSFTISVSTLPGVSLDVSDRIGRRAEEILLSIPEIQAVGRKTGRAELDEHAMGVNVSEIEAPFVLKDRSKETVLAEIRNKMKALSGVSIEVGGPITHRMDAMLSGTRAGIAIKIFGTDLNKMYAIGNQIKAAISDIEGVVDLNVEQQVDRPQLKITPRRELLGKYGITLSEFSDMVRVCLSGETISQVYEGNKTFDLVLKVDDGSRASIDDIKNLMVDCNGKMVPLSHLADVSSSVGPNTINRENISRKVVVSANVAGRDMKSVVNDIQEKVKETVALPDDYHVEYGGQFESEQSASRILFVASFFSLLVIFLLLFNQFRNAIQSLVVLLNLPLALIGGVWAVRMTGGVISIPSIIGFISLFGIATRNGLLLVAHYNTLRSEGMSPLRCVMRGSVDRLNPILMTALTSALALIPMIIGGDLPGNEIQSPMAKVILGGLFTSTLLNGFIIPIMYLITHRETVKEQQL